MSDSSIHRVARNTFMLYIRMLLILFVSLYTVRVVLNALGVEDFGIYNVVAGVVLLFSFLSTSMASATQRFFSFALGKKDTLLLKKIFCTNMLIYLTIAVVAVLLLETIGLWFIKNRLNVPAIRLSEVCVLYHFSMLTLIGGIFTSPFMAIIIAHEDMQIYAFLSIVDAAMKLAAAYLLLCISQDKLVGYGILLFGTSVVTAALYAGVCIRRYQECRFRNFIFDRQLSGEILAFTWWTLFGNLSTVIRTQGVTILLNQIFSPVIVAAQAIALKVSGVINIFSNSFNVGLYPPVIKHYAAGENKEMMHLIFLGSKITFFLMWILALPLLLKMDYILHWWLKDPPPNAVLFSRLALIESAIAAISLPIATAARAPGKMKMYELTLGIIQITILPLSWLFLKYGCEAYVVFVIAIGVNLVMFIVRLLIVRKLIELPCLSYLYKVALPAGLVVAVSFFPVCYVNGILPDGFIGSCIVGGFSLMCSSLAMFFIAFRKEERLKIRNIMLQKIKVFSV